MLRLFKYLKPYTLWIILAVVLLFVQANADLALPDYLSRIVNNGLQQSGITHPVPEAIRKSQMDKLLLLMNEDEQAAVIAAYNLLEPSDPQAGAYLDTYPTLAGQALYLLNTKDQETIDRLTPILSKALVVTSGIQQMIENPEQAGMMGEGLGFDPTKLPAGMDVFDILANLPPQQVTQIKETINQMLAAQGENRVNQMAIAAVKAEYQAIGMDIGKIQTDYILRIGGTMLLISLLGGVCTVVVGFFASRTSAGAARDIREDTFRKVESFSGVEFNKFSTASLITRSTNDVTQVQRVIFMLMRMVLYAPIIGIGAIIRAVDKSANMWWIIAVAVITLLGLIIVIFSISLPKFKLMQKLIDRLNLVTRENLSGMMVIRAFNKQEDEAERFDKANQDLKDTSLFVTRVMVSMMPIMMLLMNGLSLGIIWVGAKQVAASTIQVGDMMAFMQYAIQIVFAFLMMSMMFIFLPRAAVSGE